MIFTSPSRRNAVTSRIPSILCAALLGTAAVSAQNLEVNFDDKDSIYAAATSIAYNMMTYYTGNQTGQSAGMFPGSGTPTGYYWWEGSEAFAALMDYNYYFGNTGYNQVVTDAMQHQAGPDANYQPQNQTFDLGNDDQAYWGLAAMEAAEVIFPNPPDSEPQWLALAQAVYNMQVPRYDTTTCGGGLRWQFNFANAGYDYKSSIAQGGLMNIAARIGLYTGNTTYLDMAEKLYDWTVQHNLIDGQGNVFDGTSVSNGCSDVNRLQYSSNAGIFVQATAAMWNATKLWNTGNPSKWQAANTLIVGRTITYFWTNGAPVEKMCETIGTCNNDMKSYKSDLVSELAWSAKVAPFGAATIAPALLSAAQAAMSVCNCGSPGQCSFKWTQTGVCDNFYGLGQQINALRVLMTQADKFADGPTNEKIGGPNISKGKADAGAGGSQDPNAAITTPVTTGDKAGAGILTTLVVIGIIGGAIWMVL